MIQFKDHREKTDNWQEKGGQSAETPIRNLRTTGNRSSLPPGDLLLPRVGHCPVGTATAPPGPPRSTGSRQGQGARGDSWRTARCRGHLSNDQHFSVFQATDPN